MLVQEWAATCCHPISSPQRCSLCCLLPLPSRLTPFLGSVRAPPYSCTPRAHRDGNSQKGHSTWHIQPPRAAIIWWKSENLTMASLAAFWCFWKSINNQLFLESVNRGFLLVAEPNSYVWFPMDFSRQPTSLLPVWPTGDSWVNGTDSSLPNLLSCFIFNF